MPSRLRYVFAVAATALFGLAGCGDLLNDTGSTGLGYRPPGTPTRHQVHSKVKDGTDRRWCLQYNEQGKLRRTDGGHVIMAPDYC